MPKIAPDALAPANPATVADGAALANGGTVATAPPAVAESVEAVRASVIRDAGTTADGLARVLGALALPPPAFIASRPVPGARASTLAPADVVLSSDLWADAEGVAELVGRLGGFLSSAGAVALFTAAAVPVPFHRRPRLGFRAGDTAADVEARAAFCRHGAGTVPVAAPAGFARYTCELTGAAFVLPLCAPVPCLLFDTGARDVEPEPGAPVRAASPFDFAERSPLHPAEYVGAKPDGASGYDVHPALVEAGPAHVLGAAWTGVERRFFDAVEALADVCELAAALSGVEPEAVGVEWPALAYRRWERVERPGEPRTWTRELAGVYGAGM